MLVNGVILHHDNAPPHTEALAIEIIWKLKLKLLPPPSIQSRSWPIWLPHFQTTHRCIMWMPVCKWRG